MFLKTGGVVKMDHVIFIIHTNFRSKFLHIEDKDSHLHLFADLFCEDFSSQSKTHHFKECLVPLALTFQVHWLNVQAFLFAS